MKNKFLLLGIILVLFACTEDDKLPKVVTSPITDITYANAISGGEVIDEGSSPVIKRGVCISENGDRPPVIGDWGTWYTIDGSGTGSFTSTVGIKWHGAALNRRSTHYVRAFATNSEGTAYGEVLSFYPGDKPLSNSSIHIKSVTVTSNSADIEFDYYFPIYTVREIGFCYSTEPNPTVDNECYIVENTLYSITIENLNSYTQYYVRGYEKNDASIVYSNEKSFITEN